MAELRDNGKPLADEKIGGADAELLHVARRRYEKAVDADSDNYDEALLDLELLSGKQWPDDVEAERREDGRPVLTVNRMPTVVAQVTGDIRQNRPAIKVRPADDKSDEKVAEVYSGIIRHIEAASDAGSAYVTAAESAAQCGIGHFRIVTEYSGDDGFEQDIRVKRIPDPFAVTWDPMAIEPTRSDARYCFVEETLDIETFRARYPDADLSGWDFLKSEGAGHRRGAWLTNETVRVAEYWTRAPEKRTLALLADGRAVDITGLEKDADGLYIDTATGLPLDVVRTRTAWRDRIEMRIISGAQVLEGPFRWAGRYIPIIPVMGEEIHIGRRTVRYGVIRFARDAQRMYNFWRSAQTEKIALEPKVPWLVTATNVEGLEHQWAQANRRNLPYLIYTPDPDNNGKEPQRNAPQMGSSAMMQETLVAADDIKATTRIFDAALGNRSNETSGRAIVARQRESDTGTYVYADNLTRAIRRAGMILVDLIPTIYDTERAVRILNEDESSEALVINQTVEAQMPDGSIVTRKVNDLSLGKYDVIVTTGPSYSTKRAEAADGIIAMIQAMPEVGGKIADILARNMDWPGADEIAERLRKLLPPGLVEPEEGEEPAPPPAPRPEQMAAMAEVERENAVAAADIAKTEAETEAQRLENAKAAMQMAIANGALDHLVNARVAQMLAQMFASRPEVSPVLQPDQVAGPAME